MSNRGLDRAQPVSGMRDTRVGRSSTIVQAELQDSVVMRPHAVAPPPPAFAAIGAICAAAVAAIVWGEIVTWRASRQSLPGAPGAPADRAPADRGPGSDGGDARGRDAVVVLGFRSSRSGRINTMQRHRVRIAVRSVDRRSAMFVFSGAAVRGARSEAHVMAEYGIRHLGIPRENVVIEDQAMTTWQNITYSLPLVADAATIRIASNTFHARRARRYVLKQSPEAFDRLRRAADYRPLRLGPLSTALAVYEVVRARRAG